MKLATTDNCREFEYTVSACETAIDRGEDTSTAVDTAPHKESDMAHGSKCERKVGGGHGGGVFVADLKYYDEFEGEQLNVFLQLVCSCQTVHKTRISENKLVALLLQTGWRDWHFGLIPHNHDGLGGQLSIHWIRPHHWKTRRPAKRTARLLGSPITNSSSTDRLCYRDTIRWLLPDPIRTGTQ
jgi:hypothetical protein